MRTFGTHAPELPKGMFTEVLFPVLAYLDTWTDDGRYIDSEGFDAPGMDDGGTQPLMFLEMTTEQHLQAQLAGYIDEVTLGDDGLLSGKGWAEDTPTGQRMATAIDNKVMRGNSVDLSSKDVEMDMAEDSNKIKTTYRGVKFRGTTVVPHPAFDGAYAEIPNMPEMGDMPPMEPITAAALATFNTDIIRFRNAGPSTKPDAALFENPGLKAPTACQVEADGRVYGHLATWGTAHASMGMNVTPPRSRTNYAYFASKAVLTTGGKVPTGALVIGGNHAPQNQNWREAIDFYANSTAAWADVNVGEDEWGIWFAGQVRPGTSDETVYAGRASALSGDWRAVGGSLELVAALSVNTPGFPIPRAAAFAHEGEQLSLVSAGILRPEQVQSLSADRDVKFMVDLLARREADTIVAGWD